MNEWNINTSLPIDYTIKISNDLFSVNNNDLLQTGEKKENMRRLIVIDKNVYELYSKKILNYFNHYDVKCSIVLLEGGEQNKNLDALMYLLSEIEKFGLLRRGEPIIAIGGGVVLDIVGQAASMFRRGVPYIRIPTTLLGIVDVSVAAKTGINFLERRNRIGSYYPPIAVYLDKIFIKTQNSLEISSGMGEILKMAIVKDNKLFELLETYGEELLETKFQHEISDEVIERSIIGMIEELEINLWEKNLKRLVDFGHSFSPIIEMRSINTENPLTHGQAVTLDVLYSCLISKSRGMLSSEEVKRIFATTKRLKLPLYHPLFGNSILLKESLSDTMKHRNGKQNLPIPVRIGKSIFINDFKYEELIQICEQLKEKNEK
ncbi:sedoheptulose 7-phosphate cyclase [Candidatus Woesearchaeota archaeon]|jgi:2-epi-5-epi-valiolone synthase|nr:sedoheptulose 7-phosphate cyclase [Candidatus Woesearchaeota archaeon]MBT6735112.1 sedoheptulose 7-phosphate cyclase [Candidatus Woesearchaeota archaeon]